MISYWEIDFQFCKWILSKSVLAVWQNVTAVTCEQNWKFWKQKTSVLLICFACEMKKVNDSVESVWEFYFEVHFFHFWGSKVLPFFSMCNL